MVNLTRQHALHSHPLSICEFSDHPSPPFLDSTSTRFRGLQRNCSLAPKESISNPKMRAAAPKTQLQPFAAADAHEAAVVFSLAFADDPVEKVMCSEVSAEQKCAIRAEEYERGPELPGAHVIKAVDVANGKLVGAVGFIDAGGLQWMLPPREGAGEMERGINMAVAERREKVLQGQYNDVWGKFLPGLPSICAYLIDCRGIPAVCTPGLPAPRDWKGDATMGTCEGG
jgi:hypothetical protein